MSKQVHYVVCVDLDSKEWWIDDETFISRFEPDEGTWDTDTNQWSETNWEDHIQATEILRNSR